MKSMRLEEHAIDSDSSDRLNVIEVRLKASPRSIAVNDSTCQFAIGLQTRVLIYGLSGEEAAGSQRRHFR